jgi:hypothetical protein
MDKEELDRRIQELIESGEARSKRSAANKLHRDIREQPDGETTIEGLFLQTYERRDQSVSIYVLGKGGEVYRVTLMEDSPEPEVDLEVGMPVEIGPVTRMKNVFTGSTWMNTQDNTRTARAERLTGESIQDWAGDLEDIEDDGLYCVSGVVRFVNLVSIWEEEDGERQNVGNKALIDGDNVNLRLALESSSTAGEGQGAFRASVKILDMPALAHLLDVPELDWLRDMEEEDAVQEIADCCMGMEVVVFGRGSRVLTDRAGNVTTQLDRPFLDIGRVGFLQVVGE